MLTRQEQQQLLPIHSFKLFPPTQTNLKLRAALAFN